ncbi:hypothetical protein LshimejAT787_3700140 [Lyophyllum shimeji]|uniref:Transcription activator GCR1-like domain-containing protein n=1 Tax=Lyophyllum shimeji TaxID=47721 RepID=A0A9P3UX95_LYOSH|nr:hypothetical protein LshimejAT787_3700140 [Lyophyllum shimeji]
METTTSRPMSRKKSTKTKMPTECPPNSNTEATARQFARRILGHKRYRRFLVVRIKCENDVSMSSAASVAESYASVPAPAHSAGLPLSSPERMRYSLQALNNETHATCNEVLAAEQDDKSTGGSYMRALNRYKIWWSADQARVVSQDPVRKEIPALPITAAKWRRFYHMSQRGQREHKEVINGLEYHRHQHQHEYPDDPDARGLRSDKRVRAFESASKHNEPKRADNAQVLKAAGTSSDTYTPDELARQLLWSDLFMKMVPMPDLGLDVHVPVLVALADNGKTNQSGRVDEFGAFRHRRVELCAVGSLAMLFFGYFHILGMPAPDFMPDFTANGYGEYGRRAWYEYHVFSTTTPESQMSYDAHRNRVLKIHMANQISITKVTHATRPYAAQMCRSNGATSDGTKALGGWSENGSYRQCYDRALPIDALLGAAMFNAHKPETYCLPRDYLEPPAELLSAIFPWIENAEATRVEREEASVKNRDIALRQFLLLLTWLRTVLLQDAAILSSTIPMPPSSTEENTRLALHNLPRQMVQTLEGVLTGHALQMQLLQDAHRAELLIMRNEVIEMKGVVNLLAGSKRSRNTRPRATASLSLAATPASPAPPMTQISAVAAAVNVHAHLPVWRAPLHSALHCSLYRSRSLHCAFRCLSSNFSLRWTASAAPASVSTALLDISSSNTERSRRKVGRVGPTLWRDPVEASFSRMDQREWLPHYKYKALPAITDIWTEWTVGWEGYIPVRVLEEVWDARWRRNVHSQRTEHGRRKKVISLVTELSEKPNWGVKLALRFIAEKYEPRYKPRAFIAT